MTQNLFTVSEQTNIPGQYVTREKTIKGVKAIVEGELDQTLEEKLLYIGGLDDLK